MSKEKRTIINYTTFKDNAEFIKWQTDGTKKNIHTVVPQLMEIGLDMTEYDLDVLDDEGSKKANGSGRTTFGVFVTYLTEIEDDSSD